MNSHPGGEEHTRRMLELAGLPHGVCVLDMGAGSGETLQLLRMLGYEARGIDLVPRALMVEEGDFLQTGFPEESYDAVISQCAFYISGNAEQALLEAHRILKPDGILLLSDVFPDDPFKLLKRTGFEILTAEECTAQWKDYYIEALWREEQLCRLPCIRCSYWLLIGRRMGNGSF